MMNDKQIKLAKLFRKVAETGDIALVSAVEKECIDAGLKTEVIVQRRNIFGKFIIYVFATLVIK